MLCPHDRAVRLERITGIMSYQHESDSTSCAALNGMKVSAESLLIAYAEHGWSDTIRMQIALESRRARVLFFTRIENATTDYELTLLLHLWAYSTEIKYMSELYREFGEPVYWNLQQLGLPRPVLSTTTRSSTVAKRQMHNLDWITAHAYRTTVKGDLENELQRTSGEYPFYDRLRSRVPNPDSPNQTIIPAVPLFG